MANFFFEIMFHPLVSSLLDITIFHECGWDLIFYYISFYPWEWFPQAYPEGCSSQFCLKFILYICGDMNGIKTLAHNTHVCLPSWDTKVTFNQELIYVDSLWGYCMSKAFSQVPPPCWSGEKVILIIHNFMTAETVNFKLKRRKVEITRRDEVSTRHDRRKTNSKMHKVLINSLMKSIRVYPKI